MISVLKSLLLCLTPDYKKHEGPVDSSLPTSSPSPKEVLPATQRKPKAPPHTILSSSVRNLFCVSMKLLTLTRMRGPPPKTALPRAPSLKRSKSRGRANSRTLGERSRSQTSPERVDRQKAGGCLPSSSFVCDGSPSFPAMPPLPDDPSSPTLKAELLKWIATSLKRDWTEGAKAWMKLHVGLCICHPRCLAACTVSKDLTLEEPFCCWACNKRPQGSLPGEVYCTLWPTHTAFVWHWYFTHANASQKANLANSVGVDASDLTFELLGIDLSLWPLPWKPEAIASLPKSLPPMRGAHNFKIYGEPRYMQDSDAQHAMVPPSSNRPRPPTYPPPSNLRSNKAGPIRPLPKPAPGSSSGALPASGSSDGAKSKAGLPIPCTCKHQSDLLRFWRQETDSNINDQTIEQSWGGSTHSTDCLLGVCCWNGKSLHMWLLLPRFEAARLLALFGMTALWSHPPWGHGCLQHTFYVYLLASLVTKIMSRKNILPFDDRVIIFARFTVYSNDLKEKCHHFATFRLTSDLPTCANAIMDHVYSVFDLGVPLLAKYSFIKALEWVGVPSRARMATLTSTWGTPLPFLVFVCACSSCMFCVLAHDRIDFCQLCLHSPLCHDPCEWHSSYSPCCCTFFCYASCLFFTLYHLWMFLLAHYLPCILFARVCLVHGRAVVGRISTNLGVSWPYEKGCDSLGPCTSHI